MYYIIIGSVFVSIVLLIMAFGSQIVFKRKSKSSISQLSYYATGTGEKKKAIPSFTERMVLPVFGGISRFMKKISPKGIVKSNRQKLITAGIYGTYGVDIYLALHKLQSGGVKIDKNSKLGKYFQESNVYIKFNYKWDYQLEK